MMLYLLKTSYLKIIRFDEKDKQDIEALMHNRNLCKADIDRLVPEIDVPEVWSEAWEIGLQAWRKWTPT